MATAKKPAAIVVHRDKLGRELALGDIVATCNHNSLTIARITKFNPKMLNLTSIEQYAHVNLKYPVDTVKLDGPEVVMWLLKHSSK